jgi:protocatechuate 3,4-dioxygenase beta subunit
MHVIEPGRCTYYIEDVLFDDDPLLTPLERSRRENRGGIGLAVPLREGSGWVVTRDIVLGAAVPGYPKSK